MSPSPSDPVIYAAKLPLPSTTSELESFRGHALRSGPYNNALSANLLEKTVENTRGDQKWTDARWS